MQMLYQVGTAASLFGGVDEGDVTCTSLAEYGDFGLGTFNAVRGEMVAYKGHFYRIDAEGQAHAVPGYTKTPFAVVTRFRPERRFSLHRYDALSPLRERIASEFESPNLIYAVHVEGIFSSLRLRSEHSVGAMHLPLKETLPKLQTSVELGRCRGSMVGFWFPDYMKPLNLPGFHFHFIDAARRRGGHLHDMRLEHGTAEIMPIHDFGMHLIHTPLFETRPL